MDSEIARIKVILEASTANFKRSMNEIRNITKQATNEIQRETAKVREATSLSGVGQKETEEFKRVKREIASTERALEGYYGRQTKMRALGTNRESKGWISLAYDIRTAEQKLRNYKEIAKEMETNGSAYTGQTSKKNAVNNVSESTEAMKSAIESVNSVIADMQRSMSETTSELRRTMNAVRSASSSDGVRGFTRLSKAIKKVGQELGQVASNGLKKFTGAFSSLIHRFASGIPVLGKFIGGQKSMNNGFSSGLKNILKYGLGIRSLYALVNKIRSGIVEGFKNLAQYSDETNSSISMLMSSASQLKNAFAAAFNPLLNAIAPILDAIIQKVISAVNAFGQLVGALTGNATYIRARKQNLDYAASLNQNASAANNAAKANQNLKRSIMGFDQINKMEDNSSNDSGSGGSDNGGYNTPNPEDMFTTESIPSKMKGIADTIKQAWESADFTNIGSILGTKLNDALNAIPWDTIKSTLNKVASSVATFLNGFMSTTDFSLIGATLAEKLNTIWGAVGTFANKFDFSALGTKLSELLNGYFNKLDLKEIATTFSTVLIKAFNTGISFFQGVRWNEIGQKCLEGLKSIQWSDITSKFFELMGAALGGIGEFIGGLISEKVQSAKDYFSQAIEDMGGNVADGIMYGIGKALRSIGTWIYDNIFTPFIDGFKSVFGIHSPSTVMAKMGGYLISGLKEGAVEKFKVFISWVKLLPSRIKTAIGNIKEFIKSKGLDLVEGIKQGAINKWNTAKEWFTSLKDKAKNAVGNIRDHVKSKGYDFVEGIKSAAISKWDTAKEWFTSFKDKAKNAIGNIKDHVKSKGSDIIGGIKSGATGAWGDLSSFLNGLKTSISNALPNLWDIGRNWIDGLIQGFESISIPTPHIEEGRGWNAFGGRIHIPSFHVSWYASGGFPEMGQLFVANEAGPEMVGKMGNKTTVANQQQIVDGIKAGVFEAMMDAFNASGALSGSGSGEQITEFTVKIDSETLYKKVKKGKERYERRFQTVEAF